MMAAWIIHRWKWPPAQRRNQGTTDWAAASVSQGANMKKFILLSLTLMLMACSAGGASEFDKNKATWDNANISNYRYTLGVSCFCPFMEDMPVTVEVQNDQVVSITSVKGTTIDSTNEQIYPFVESYTTIDKLFEQLKSAQADADEVTVAYDPTYGFPTSIAIDHIKEAIDDEMYLTVENFEVLK
jgi:hypothetical protein